MTTNSPRLAIVAAFTLLAMLVCPGVGAVASPRHHGHSSAQKNLEKDYALIYGTVWGANNYPVYGVHIKVRRANEKKARWEAYSDHAGEFAVRVPPGKVDYIVWADIKVPKGKAKPQVAVHIEDDERQDIALHLTQ